MVWAKGSEWRKWDLHVHGPAFDVVDAIVLGQPAGWALIDDPLQIVGVKRLGASAPVKEIVDELPPEEPDGG